MIQPDLRHLREWLLLGLFFLLLGVAYYPEALTGKVVWDERFSEYIPWRMETARLLREGEFPAFTDRVFAGTPLFAQSYTGVLYPPNWLYVFFGVGLSNWLAVLHTMLGGLGMAAYLRGHRFTWVGTTVGATAFLTMTFLVNHADHISMREAALWAPWVAWGALRAMKRPDWRGALCFAVPLTLQVATGYLQIVFFTAFWVGAEWIARVRLSRASVRATASLVAGGLLACALMAPQLIAAKRMAPFTPRETMTLEFWQQSSFPPSHLLLFAQPRALGMPGGEWIGEEFPAEILSVLMPWALVLALIGVALGFCRIRRNPRRRWMIALLMTVIAGVILSFGKYFGPNAHLFHVPPFNYFRISDRWLFLVCALLAALSASGADHLLRLKSWHRPLAMVGTYIGAASVLVLAGRVLDPLIVADYPLMQLLARADGAWTHLLALAAISVLFIGIRRFPVPVLVGICLIALVESTDFDRSAHIEPVRPEFVLDLDEHPLFSQVPRDSIDRLYALYPGDRALRRGELLPHNTNLFAGIPALSGYTPLVAYHITLFLGIDQHGMSWFDHETFLSPATLRKSGVSHVVFFLESLTEEQQDAWDKLADQTYRIVAQHDDMVLAELVGAGPRFQSARSWHHAGDVNDVGAGLRDATLPVEDHSVAIFEAPESDLPPSLTELPRGAVRPLELRGSMQRLRVSAHGDGVLLIRDTWWPGWRYRYENGHEGHGAIMRADGVFRAVPLPAGEYDLVMSYRTPGMRLGMLVALLGLVGFVAWSLLPWCAARWRSR